MLKVTRFGASEVENKLINEAFDAEGETTRFLLTSKTPLTLFVFDSNRRRLKLVCNADVEEQDDEVLKLLSSIVAVISFAVLLIEIKEAFNEVDVEDEELKFKYKLERVTLKTFGTEAKGNKTRLVVVVEFEGCVGGKTIKLQEAIPSSLKPKSVESDFNNVISDEVAFVTLMLDLEFATVKMFEIVAAWTKWIDLKENVPAVESARTFTFESMIVKNEIFERACSNFIK